MRYGGVRFIPPSKITEIAIAWPEMLIANSFAVICRSGPRSGRTPLPSLVEPATGSWAEITLKIDLLRLLHQLPPGIHLVGSKIAGARINQILVVMEARLTGY